MPSARKRTLQEVEVDNVAPNKDKESPSLLHQIRDMWQFSNLFQFILLFGKVLKVDDSFDIDDLETECLKPQSTMLQDIGLCFLKFLSSHRGLTHELFDEYTRRQYLAKAPNKNPFGDEETPAKFADFNVFAKIRILQDMTQFIMMHPERLREKTEEQKDMDQTNWRIEPYGWDSDERTYFVLDDNRIYRLTEAPPPPPKPKKNSKKARAARRASKRQRISAALASDGDEAGDEGSDAGQQADAHAQPEDDGLGGMKWECIAVTLDEVRGFLSTIQKTKDSNEKILRDRIQDHLVPILERQEESRKRKQLQREKELLSLEKMANAKRSSRIAGKVEQQKHLDQIREEERRQREEEVAARKEEQKRLKIERERDNRQMSREQRLRDREARRIQHEEELAQLSEDSKSVGDGNGRLSQRRLLAEIEKRQQALKELEEEEEDWFFDCICGVHGKVDDGTHSVACERCNVWQHSNCLGIKEEDAEQENFHFICDSCRQSEQEAGLPQRERPKIIKLKVQRSRPAEGESKAADGSVPPATQPVVGEGSLEGERGGAKAPEPGAAQENGDKSITAALNVEASKALLNGYASNLFSAPHPTLSPPDLSPNKSRTYSTIFSQPGPAMNSDGDHSSTVTVGGAQGGNERVAAPLPSAGSGSEAQVSRQAEQSVSRTKNVPPMLPIPGLSGTRPAAPNLGSTSGVSAVTPVPIPTPEHSQPSTQIKHDERSSPLPSPRGGLSPIKHSPPLPQRQSQQQANGTATSSSKAANASAASPKPAILPPVTALSPTPQQQILTPPVKPSEPARSSQQGHSSPGGPTK